MTPIILHFGTQLVTTCKPLKIVPKILEKIKSPWTFFKATNFNMQNLYKTNKAL